MNTYNKVKGYCLGLACKPLSIAPSDVRKTYYICKEVMPMMIKLLEYTEDLKYWDESRCEVFSGRDTSCSCTWCKLRQLSVYIREY